MTHWRQADVVPVHLNTVFFLNSLKILPIQAVVINYDQFLQVRKCTFEIQYLQCFDWGDVLERVPIKAKKNVVAQVA